MRRPPIVTIIGTKKQGKTTLTVKLAAEMHRRGHRVMTMKHGSHTFNIDPSTTDTYRHYHEGHAERVAMVRPDKFALVERWTEEKTPEQIAEQYLVGRGHRDRRRVQGGGAAEDRDLATRNGKAAAVRGRIGDGGALHCDRHGRRDDAGARARGAVLGSGVARDARNSRGEQGDAHMKLARALIPTALAAACATGGGRSARSRARRRAWHSATRSTRWSRSASFATRIRRADRRPEEGRHAVLVERGQALHARVEHEGRDEHDGARAARPGLQLSHRFRRHRPGRARHAARRARRDWARRSDDQRSHARHGDEAAARHCRFAAHARHRRDNWRRRRGPRCVPRYDHRLRMVVGRFFRRLRRRHRRTVSE